MNKEYKQPIQDIDKDFVAKSFMVACELNEVWNREKYFLLLGQFFYENDQIINTKINQARKQEKDLENEYIIKHNAYIKGYDCSSDSGDGVTNSKFYYSERTSPCHVERSETSLESNTKDYSLGQASFRMTRREARNDKGGNDKEKAFQNDKTLILKPENKQRPYTYTYQGMSAKPIYKNPTYKYNSNGEVIDTINPQWDCFLDYYFNELQLLKLAQTKEYQLTQLALKNQDYILQQKVFSLNFDYVSSWTYGDVLDYFEKYGYPRKSPDISEELALDMNIYKCRHTLRYEYNINESVLVNLLRMYNRKMFLERLKEHNKNMAVFMSIVGVVILIISIVLIPFTAGQSGWLSINAISSIISAVAGVLTSALGIAELIVASFEADSHKEQLERTRQLQLKAMPKPKNFIDQSITDPYAMYANGRLYTDSAAGKEDYDALKGYVPYNALDDKFNDSDMFEYLNVKGRDKLAGGAQYLPELYPDAKWSNKASLAILLNAEAQIYLAGKARFIQAVQKWLINQEIATFYLLEPDASDPEDKTWDRRNLIEYQDMREVLGFVEIKVFYGQKRIDFYDYIGEHYSGFIEQEEIIEYNYNVNVEYNEVKEDKLESKKGAITSSSYITTNGFKKEILKGSDIQIRKYIKELVVNKSGYEKETIKEAPMFSNTYYLVEYESKNYAEIEVKLYNKIQEILNYKEGMSESEYILGKEKLFNPQVQTKTRPIWEVRESHEVHLRFKVSSEEVFYSAKGDSRFNQRLFEQYELFNDPQALAVDGLYLQDTGDIHTAFGYKANINLNGANKNYYDLWWYDMVIGGMWVSCYHASSKMDSKFAKVKIFYKEKQKDQKCETLYFSMLPFLDFKISFTAFS